MSNPKKRPHRVKNKDLDAIAHSIRIRVLDVKDELVDSYGIQTYPDETPEDEQDDHAVLRETLDEIWDLANDLLKRTGAWEKMTGD